MKNQGQAEARRRLICFEASMSLEGEPTFSCLPGTSRDIYAQNRTKSKVFHSSDMVALLLCLNRPSKIRKYSQLIGEFRVVFFLCFKASLVANLCCNLKPFEGLCIWIPRDGPLDVEVKGNSEIACLRISLRWPIHIINPVDETKLSYNI